MKSMKLQEIYLVAELVFIWKEVEIMTPNYDDYFSLFAA